jgi:cell wall-associated NlpC family hydrolase
MPVNRVTTHDLSPSPPAATRRVRRGVLPALGSLALCLASLPAFAAGPVKAQPAVVPPPTDATPLPERGSLFNGGLSGLLAMSAPVVAPAPTLSDRIQTILAKAMTLLGTPYRWGGASPERGFDCSGLVGYVFRTALGIELPRVSREMVHAGTPVERAALTPGDLVFFSIRGRRVDHVGIYVGEGRFLHAPRTGRDVTVSSLDHGYWSRRYRQGRRVTL